MKIFWKIILLLLLITWVLYSSYSFAEDNYIQVPVWIDLTPIFPSWENWDNITCSPKWSVWWANCVVKSGFWPVQTIIWAIVKYFTFIAVLASILFVVISGIQYSMSWLDQWMKDKAKERILKLLSWIVLLLLSWTILNILFPWIYK